MRLSLRRALVATLVPVITATLSSACSDADGTSGAVGTAGAANAAVFITTTPRGVSIENRAGRQLVDVTVSIRPGGSAPTFHRTLPSLATAERKELPLSEFKSSDNVTLNPMFVRPEEISLTATDDAGTDYHVAVPWK